jgi:hypothetical protein
VESRNRIESASGARIDQETWSEKEGDPRSSSQEKGSLKAELIPIAIGARVK